MAQEFKLLFVLCLVAASLVSEGAVEATGGGGGGGAGAVTVEATSTASPTLPALSTTAAEASSSTASPEENSSTTGGTSSSTAAPEENSSTTRGASSSTAAPEENSSTTGGASSSTATPEENSSTTGGASSATAAPTAPQTNVTSEITTPPQPTSDPCTEIPCGQGSTCEPRGNSSRVCLCLAGDFYNDESQSCVKAKVFPGQLQILNLTYSSAMANKMSKEFLDAAVQIGDALKDSFNRSDFSGSTVLEIRKIKKSRVWSRSENGVDATVEIFFKASSSITTKEFEEQMKTAASCVNCLLEGATFSGSPLCDEKACDAETTLCSAVDGVLSCGCLDGYIKTNFSDRICIACPSGKKASEDQMQCDNCPFGYSGLNCKESWQLILVIVGSVLGGLLLITLILLPVVALKSSKKGSKKSKYADAGEPYISPPPVKAPLGNSGIANSQAAPVNGSANAFANVGMPRIPRAATPSSWSTNLEMTPSNSRQNLIPAGRNSRLYEDQDDMAPYAQSRPQSSLYGQARPQNNPYAQSRPQTNPYASSQGQSNPYYTHDNGRRFN